MPEKDIPFELSLPKWVITGGPPTYTIELSVDDIINTVETEQ